MGTDAARAADGETKAQVTTVTCSLAGFGRIEEAVGSNPITSTKVLVRVLRPGTRRAPTRFGTFEALIPNTAFVIADALVTELFVLATMLESPAFVRATTALGTVWARLCPRWAEARILDEQLDLGVGDSSSLRELERQPALTSRRS